MLVRAYEENAEGAVRNLDFEVRPKIGDQVELDGVLHKVTSAWHQPNEGWSEPKLAVVLRLDSAPDAHPRFGGSW